MSELEEKVLDVESREVDTENVKCDGCGSNMVFDPEDQRLECPHCGNSKSFATDAMAKEINILEGFESSAKWESSAAAFSCDNCGAKVVLGGGETATVCPFCGTAHAMKKEELQGVKPNALIPFAFNVEKALSLGKDWARKRFFAPRKFKKNICSDNLKGVYTPCFTFDSYTTSYYEGRIGKTHVRTVGSGKNRRTQTYIVWRNIRGTFLHNFDDVLITAGSKFNQSNLDKVSPFETNVSKEYEENYLLGFMAYQYDEDFSECWQKAKGRIDAELRRLILSQYVHDTVAYLNVSTAHEKVTYKYVMLPVYVGNFKYKQKLYNYFINGSSGKVGGKTPLSALKIVCTVLLAVAAVVALALLFTS